MNSTISVTSLLQSTWLVIASICAVGFTVIVKLSVGPSLLTPPFVNVGVTIMVATRGSVPKFAAVKFRSPAPVSPAPISISDVQA